jgi:ubiquinone/menaquinone biosynthesis C-methylase UbiE
MTYADTPASQAQYDAYYADLSKYSDSATGTGAGAQGWDRERLADTAKAIAARLGDPAARVIDIGCANGGLLAELRALGYENLFGVDPSPACVAATASHPGIRADVGTLFSMPNGARDADCVVLSHVLEHVRDVAAALKQLHSLVVPGGLVYVEVPDARRYVDYLVAPFQDFNVEHINHFSPVSLANTLAANGFAVESTMQKTIEASAGVPYPAVAALARAGDDPSPISPDDEAVERMSAYIAQSRAQVAVMDRNLDRALSGVEEIVIWGAGQTTLTLLSQTRVGGARVVALTDSNPRYHGRRLGGVPVVAPNALASMSDVPILIGTLIHHTAIEQRIRELGLPNRVVRLSVT